jgi:hypothetical protein
MMFSRLVLVGSWLGVALGCAHIFGIEDACVVGEPGCSAAVNAPPASGCSGGALSGDAGTTEECSSYCARISQKCSLTPQYDDARCECQQLCPYFPTTPGGVSGNSLECRIDKLDLMSGEPGDCYAAGRLGARVCGNSCDIYCSLMRQLCPAHFEAFDVEGQDDLQSCMTECNALVDRGEFDPSPAGPDAKDTTQPTVQCRLWHLGAAAIERPRLGLDNMHCDHALGLEECLPAPGRMR